jgi:hypothetical protein
MTGFRTLAIDYDVYDIAFLAGGPKRVGETALVALVETGRLRVSRPGGELHMVEPRRRHAVEAAVLDAVGSRSHRSVDTVLWRACTDGRLTSLAERLERDGLVHPAGRRTGLRRRYWRALCLTRAGRRALHELRSDPPFDRLAGGTEAMQVALGGAGRMADRDLAAVLFGPPAPAPPPTAAERREIKRERDAFLAARPPSATMFAVGGFGGGDGGFGCDGGGGGDGGGC